MQHKPNRFLAFLLSVLMLISSVPVNAFATENNDVPEGEVVSEAVHTHSPVGVEAKNATCTEDGNTAYWYCDCGQFFSDAEALNEIAEGQWVISAAGHTWDSGVVTTEATETTEGVKTYTCGCGETKEETIAMIAPHTHEWGEGVVTTEATENAEGVKTYTCSCGETKEETIAKIVPEHTHSLTPVEAKEESCQAEGNSAYWYCACGKFFSDAEGVNEIAENSWVIPAAHTTILDETVNYWVCTGCGQYFEDEAATKLFEPTQTVEDEASCAHESYKLVSETKVTCNTAGITVEKCSACGEEKRTYTVPEIAASSEGTGAAWDFTQAEIVDDAISSTNSKITLAYGKKGKSATGSDGTATAYQTLVLENGNLLSDKSYYNFSEGIALNDEDGWTMEIVAKLGEETFNETMFRGVFATGIASKPFVLIRPGADLMICTSGGTSSGKYFKLSDDDFTNKIPADYDPEEYHNYQLRHDNGEYLYYLDGELMGKLSLWETGWDRDTTKTDKLDAPTGTDATAIQNMTISKLGSGSSSVANVGFSGYLEYMGVYPTDHKWDAGQTTAPDCDTDGKTVYKCTGCSAEKEIILEATGHSWTNDCDTTCNTEGCGHTRVTEHSWDEGTVTKEPVYPENGIRTFACTICGETKEETILAACQHGSLAETPAVPATCMEGGNSAYWTCEACGLYFSDAAASQDIEKDSWIIAATGHSYAVTSETANSCNTTGVKVETCSGCGDVKTTYTPATTGYAWDFSQGSAASIQGENTLTLDGSKISGATLESLLADGTLNTLDGLTRLKMSKSVTLKASDSWIMEVTARGTGDAALGTIISTDRLASASTFVRIMKSGDLLIVKRTPTDGIGDFEGKTPVYYKVSDEDFNNSALASEGFTTEDYHTYQLRCENGVFSYWLDGEKVGNLAITEATASREDGDFAYDGTPFNFDALEINYVGIGTTATNLAQGLQAEVKNLGIYPGHAFDHACDPDCNNEGCTYTRATEHDLKHVPAVENTCQQPGNLEHWKCEKCGVLFSDANAQTVTTLDAVTLAQKDHSYGEPAFDWADDYSTCTASFTCSVGGEEETVDCEITTQTTAATCTTADVTVHTAAAVFNEKNYSDEKTVTGQALGHTYGAVEFNWAEDGTSATASVTCSVCAEGTENKVLSGNAAVTVAGSTEGDCKTNATTTYTATVTLDKEYTDTKTVDGNFGNHDLKKTEAKSATCQSEGNNAYWTCSICENVYADEATTQLTTVAEQTLQQLEHAYGEPEFSWAWSEDLENYQVTAKFTCSGVETAAHVDPVACTVEKSSTNADCVTPGTVTYTATAIFNGQTYTDTKMVSGNPLGHQYGEAVFTWAEDAKSATAAVTCSVCAEGTQNKVLSGDAAVELTDNVTGTCQVSSSSTYTATITLGGVEYTEDKTVTGELGGHDPIKTEAVDATCAAAGNNAYWTCQVEGCGKVFADEALTQETTPEKQVIDKLPHSYGEAVFVWAEDGKSATASITCGNCTEEAEGHTLSGTASVQQNGSTEGDCKVNATVTYGAEITLNGQKYTESKTVEGNLGSHKLTKTEAVEDTCVVAGHAAYWTCSVCGKLFADENGTTEIPAVEYIDEVSDTVWTFANGSADSDNGNNSLSIVKSAISGATMDSLITGGTLNTLSGKTTLGMSKAVKLGASDSWILEVTAKGDGTNPIGAVFSTGTVYTSATFARIMASGDLLLGKRTPSEGENGGFGAKALVYYKVSDEDFNNSALASEGFTTADYHTYQLRRDNGVFSFWLDGVKVGNLTITEAAANRSNRENGALVYEGTPFTFGDLEIDTLGAGTAKDYALQGMQAEVKSLSIYNAHSFTNACDPDCNAEGCTFTRDVMHTWDEGVVTVEPTETENGEKTFTCGSCGTTRKESINALQHKHQMSATEAKEPDCENNGNSAYWTCTGCKKYFSDAEGNTEIAENSWVIEAIGHTWDNGVVTKAPTSSEEGERLFTCACGATKTEKIPVGEAVSKDVVWDFSQNSATSTDGKNTLSIAAAEDGTTDINNLIGGGVLNTLSSKAALKLSESITLGASEYWTMEIVAKGNGADNIEGFFSTSSAGTSATFIRIMNSGDLMIVKRLVGASDPVFSNGTYLNYKVSNEDFSNSVLGSGNFDVTEFHTYQLRRENGVFSYWLDGVKIGDLAVTEDTAGRTGTQAAGTPFTFGDLKISHVGNGTSSKPATRGLQAVVKSMAIYAGHNFTDDCDETCNDASCTFTRSVMHIWNDGIVTVEPTVTAKGEKTYTCTLCSSTKKEDIPVLEHDHQMTATEAVEAECEKSGNSAYWQCTICKQYFSDAEGKTQIQENSWVIEQKGHRWNSGEITKAPTNTEPGERTYTCTVCSATKVEPISAAAEVVMKYDDRLDVSELGQTGAPVITNQTVTSKKVGTDTPDDAVIAYVDGKLIAVGVGHATITWGEGETAASYNLTVEPATISLIMVTGHSLGSGSQGSEAQSIVCEEGQVYSTNEKAYSFKLCTGSSSAGTVEGKDVTGMGIGYGSALRPSKINALTESGSGVPGSDSGIGYRWHQLTGEKVWILNSAKGSTNLSTWKQGGYNYRHAVALFTTAEEILYNETLAGHYKVNKLGIVNFGPGNGDQNWTADLYRESFDSMWNGFQTEMAVYDFDGDGIKDTVDCIGRIPGRNVCAMDDWDNLYPYPLAFHSLKTGETLAEGRLVGYHMSVFEDKGVIKASIITRNWTTDADVKAYFEEHPIETLYGTLQNGSTHTNPTTVRNGVLSDGTHCTQLGYNVHGVVIAENMYKYWYGLNTVESVTLLQANGVDEVPDSIEVPMGSKYVVVPIVTPSSGKLTYTVTGDAFSYYNCMVVGEKMGSGVLTIKTVDGTVLKTVNVTVVEAEEEENYENAEWYVWDFAEGKATNTSGSTLDNTLSLVASEDSSVTKIDSILNNGTLDASSRTVLKLSKPVTLNPSKNWTVEIVAKGDGENAIRTVLSTNANYSGTYIYINAKGDLSVVKKCSFTADDGTSVSSGYTNYKVSDDDYYSSILASSSFDVTEYHTYQLSCNRGVLSFWVDGEKIGDLAMSEQSSHRGSGAPQYTQGNGAAFAIKSLTMSYIGNGSTSTAYAQGLNASVKKLSIVCGSGTLTLDVNLGAAVPMDPMVIYPGYSIILPKPSTGNYCAKFIGWATNQDLSGTVYQAGQTYTVAELNSTALYGVWEANDTTDAIHNVVNSTCTYCGTHVHQYTANTADEVYICNKASLYSPATYYTSCVGCGQTSRGTQEESTFIHGIPNDGYFSVVNSQKWDIAPGITEYELILNNDSGDRRQVVHVMEVDTSNPYAEVKSSYMGMNPTAGNYQIAPMSQQAAWVEENLGLNVVGAMNTSLSWYDSDYYTQNPHLKGEPVGTTVIDGTLYSQNTNADTCLVVNYDVKDGAYRPDSIPKVQLRKTSDALTGWEEQVIPCNFGFVVKNGKNVSSTPNHENQASKSILGIKADGTIVIMQNDGRQSPYSGGLSVYEVGEAMVALGCEYAVRCDGGGSSAYLSQRPGEELKVNSSPSDGIERTTTHGILVISTAPSNGEFARASITTENHYYAPGSKVTFTAVGTDLAGTKVDIPKAAEWRIKESGMGTIKKGVFTSNGTTGTVTAQLVYNEKVVGECVIEIVIPEAFQFQQSVITVPFGKTVDLPLVATVNNGLNIVTLNTKDIVITTTNEALGTIKGISFTAVAEDKAPADLTSTITATINGIPGMTAEAQLNLGKGSKIIEDFENGVGNWNVLKNYDTTQYKFYEVDEQSGYVYDGEKAAALYMYNEDQRQSAGSYQQLYMVAKEPILIENAQSVGAWFYVPDDFYNLMITFYLYAPDENGEYRVPITCEVVSGGDVYTTFEESGWYYFSCDISEYESVMIREKGAFIAMVTQHASANALFQNTGSSFGNSTIYIDNITVDYSAAADDHEAPIFRSVTMSMNGTEVDLVKRGMVTTYSNVVNIQAVVAENELKTNATGLNGQSAKASIDGVSVDVTYADGILSLQNVALADGPHRVRFEISDNAGNTASVIRVINVKSGVNASTVEVVPADPSLDRLYGGSLYWMDVNATMIETIDQVSMDIDLNAVNHWELDHMEVAEGFSATYSVEELTNTATITITRTGTNTQAGKQTLASLPIRVIYYDTDIANPKYTAETFWKEYRFWPQDVAVDVDRGVITYVNGYSGKVRNTFSNIEFTVDTEFYTSGQHMDPAFKAERGTAHVHSATALADKTGNCTEDGYTGRTYCEVCASIVNWGTTDKAPGHKYVEKNGALTCEACGEKLNGSYEGKIYIDGVIADGWIDETYYYVDGTMITGQYLIDGKLHTFGEDGIYDPDYVFNGFYETPDGKLMYFVSNEYVTGYQYLAGANYFFDENGYGLEGEYEMSGENCLFENGQFVKSSTADLIDAGMAGETATYVLYADGTLKLGGTGATYSTTNYGSRPIALLINDINKIVVGNGITRIGTNFLALTNASSVEFEKYSQLTQVASGAFYSSKKLTEITLPDKVTYIGGSSFNLCSNLQKVVLPEGVSNMQSTSFSNKDELVLYVVADSYAMNYAIENDIKYVTYTPETITGIEIVDIGGTLYFYKDGEPYYAGMVVVDGYYYYVNSKCQVVTGRYNVGKTNDLVEPGYYDFDEETGRMLNPPVKNGIYKEDGVMYFFKDNEKYYAGLIKHDGHYYYVNSKCQVVTGSYYVNKTNDLMSPGIYDFDETGKMISTIAPDKNGIYTEDGVMYYYKDGAKNYAGLIKLDGNYYYVNSSAKVVTGKYNITKTNGLLPAGTYEFDEDGKMLNPPVEVKNGIYTEDGVMYYYKDGVKNYAGLIIIDGYYYYVNASCKVVTGHYHIGKTNGLLPKGYYDFADDGKMLNATVGGKTGIFTEDGVMYYYKDGVKNYAGLIIIDGYYYYVNASCKVVTGHYHIGKTNDLLPKGYYDFADDGKMLNAPSAGKTGIYTEDGVMYYYKDGVKNYAGLIIIDGYYYYVNASCKVVTGHYHIGKTNDLLPMGYYDFAEDGKMLNATVGGKTGIYTEDGVMYYYKDGVKNYAGLIIIDGYYYYVNASCKVVTGHYHIGKTNDLLPMGYYDFDESGRMITN